HEELATVQVTDRPLWTATANGVGGTFSPDGSHFAGLVRGADTKLTVKMWETSTGKEVFSSPVPGHDVAAPVLSAGGKRLALFFRVPDPADANTKLEPDASGGRPPPGKGQATVWDTTTGKEVLVDPKVDFPWLALSQDGTRLAAGAYKDNRGKPAIRSV